MKLKSIPLLFAFLLVGSLSLSAAQVFILFDAACMDRLEFDMNRPDMRTGDYITYHVNLRSGEKLILEVGQESDREQNYLPEPMLSCNSGGFDQGLMRRINANIDEVYIVYPKNRNMYTISRVSSAASYNKNGTVVQYESPKYRFRFDTEFGTIGENIAVNNPGAKVYFEGRIDNGCTGSYLFRQLSPQSAFPLVDIVLVPEIGIVEERSGANAAAAMNNTVQLKQVNNRSMDRFLQEVCGTEPGSQGSMIGSRQTGLQNYSATDGRINAPSNLPSGAITPTGQRVTATPSNTRPQPQGNINPGEPIMTDVTASTEPPAPTTHTVARGETLYGIARKYEVSVNDIQAWNNLQSNTIRRGQVLQVGEPAANTAPTFVSRGPVQPQFQPNEARTGTSRTLTGGMTPYDQNATGGRIETTDSNVHIVRPGETLASIALQYGYTAQKFREINDMGPNDIVRIGQRLKTSDCNCPINNNTVPNGNTSARTPTVPGANSSTPSSFNSTGGRIAPADFQSRTPVANNTPSITPTNQGVVVRNSGGLTPSSPTVPRQYNAVPANGVPNSYDAVSPRTPTSMSNLENSSSPRAIGNQTDFGNPVNTTTSRSANAGMGSPYPSPNAPVNGYENNSRPDEYYQGAAQRRTHVVAAGESLFGIARRYNTTVQRLRQLNNLGPNDPIIEYQTLYVE